MPSRISTIKQYKNFKDSHPEAAPIDEAIFENPNFISLTYNSTSIKDNPLWKVTYRTSEGIEHQATEKQLVQFMLRKKSNDFDKAALGLTSWEGRPIVKVSEEKQNFIKMISRFFPEDGCAGLFDNIEDKFFKNLATACSGWKIDSKNFENSPKKCEIVRMNNKPRFIQVRPAPSNVEYTEDDIREISAQIYEEECNDYGKFRLDTLGRQIVNERTKERLLRETGYKFDYMEYDAKFAWFDSNTMEIAACIIGDFCEALNRACQYINPGSSAGIQELRDENTSPIAATAEYKRSVKEGLREFGCIFNLVDNPHIHDRTYMINNVIVPRVEQINSARGKETRKIHKTIYKIAETIYDYYRLRSSSF